jgi:hypothetical protein
MSPIQMKIIPKIVNATAPGPKPTFTAIDVIKILLLLGRDSPLGRKTLASQLSLGEGVTRTLIYRLQQNQLLIIQKKGCDLTVKGKKLYEKLCHVLTTAIPVEVGTLSLGKWNYAILIHGATSRVKAGIEQRDAAVRAGALGASTLIYSRDRFNIPPDREDCETTMPSAVWSSLRKTLRPRNGDVLIIAGANSKGAAEDGAIAAALALIRI